MARLRVREFAEARGLSKARLQIKAGISMGSVRRYWYGTRDGAAAGEPLQEVDLIVLQALARALDVEISDLFAPDLDSGDILDSNIPDDIRTPGHAANALITA